MSDFRQILWDRTLHTPDSDFIPVRRNDLRALLMDCHELQSLHQLLQPESSKGLIAHPAQCRHVVLAQMRAFMIVGTYNAMRATAGDYTFASRTELCAYCAGKVTFALSELADAKEQPEGELRELMVRYLRALLAQLEAP